MKMIKKIAAHYIFPIHDKPIKNGVLSYDEHGKILEITQVPFNVQEISGLEFYAGILVPGFVNAHCHLELSHMKSMIPENTGLPGFISKISTKRETDEETLVKTAQNADVRMWYNGIAAVGDISNKNISFTIKQKSKITYHTFLELFSTIPSIAQVKFNEALRLQQELQSIGLASSIVPHAPYSVSSEMFDLIEKHSTQTNQPICMHNQESPDENELYRTKSGNLVDVFRSIGINFDAITQTGKNSLESVMYKLNRKIKCILVHNTYSTLEDIEKASDYFENLYWCFCPNSNLYIENSLPNIPIFIRKKQKINIGTDSLASNHQLSILEEIKTISRNYPEIGVDELFRWASLNGAEALGLSDQLGSLEPGKTPGINLIRNFDLNNFRFKKETEVKRII